MERASAKVEVWFKGGYRDLEGCYFLPLRLEASLALLRVSDYSP